MAYASCPASRVSTLLLFVLIEPSGEGLNVVPWEFLQFRLVLLKDSPSRPMGCGLAGLAGRTRSGEEPQGLVGVRVQVQREYVAARVVPDDIVPLLARYLEFDIDVRIDDAIFPLDAGQHLGVADR